MSLTAMGLTTGEIAAHFDDVNGAKISKDNPGEMISVILPKFRV